MKNRTFKTWAGYLVVVLLVGCTSRPVLRQVPEGATEKPINTPEQAQALQEKHSK